MKKAFNLIVMGAPGGGKGTISKKLVSDYKFTHLSTGDLLRSHVSRGSDLGNRAKDFILKGALVPDHIVIDMIASTYSTLDSGRLLLDGFPRTLVQAETLNSVLPIHSVVYLDIPHDTIIARLSSRWVHGPSGRTYAYDYNPPRVIGLDDVTGEPLSQRDDDKPETIRARLEAFDKQTLPLFEYYKERNLPFKAMKFRGTESNVIYRDIKEYLDPLLG